MSGLVFKARDLLGVTPTEKLLLMVLASHANDKGIAFPSNQHLEATTRLHVRTVQRTLVDLECRELIQVVYSTVPSRKTGQPVTTSREIHMLDKNWKNTVVSSGASRKKMTGEQLRKTRKQRSDGRSQSKG